ncbi:MAG: 1-deoxy-D-xylulose-5-phosphate reductoisomerase [Alphaproteobacteria bacterium]|nr:1-deoxy-D-xylulose-5-phosphate reductoisomerase [Alphaproteobacteria bacterium]
MTTLPNVDKRCVSILGVTGSIGRSTIDVITNSPDLFDVYAVTAHKNVSRLAEIAKRLSAKKAIIADETQKEKLQSLLEGSSVTVEAGQNAVISAAGEKVDLVVAAIMGFAGLKPIIAALEQGNNVALANKEPLVAAGEMIMALAKENNANILPVDSEHNAIFQVFEEENRAQIDRLILTASGGPFLHWNKEEMDAATPEQAVAHPTWNMGAKISVDSATLMNKALEIIEAAHLFSMSADKIDVVIHPQSTIHSIVSYKDGSMLSQMGASDMRTPIASALGWPNRLDKGGNILDITMLTEGNGLTFEKPDTDKFPSILYAYKCLELGQAACITLNAANEVAVARFLNHEIAFGDIMRCVTYSIDILLPKLAASKICGRNGLKTVGEIEKLDTIVRQATNEFIDISCKAPEKAA